MSYEKTFQQLKAKTRKIIDLRLKGVISERQANEYMNQLMGLKPVSNK